MKKTIIVLALVLSGIAVLASPLVFFMAIFAFDQPLSNAFEEAVRGAAVLIVISYPVTFFYVAFWIRQKWREGIFRYSYAVLAITPVLQLVVPILMVLYFSGELENRKKKIAEGLYIGKDTRGAYIVWTLREGIYRKLIGPEIVYYCWSENQDYIFVKRAPNRYQEDGTRVIEVSNSSYFVVSPTTLEIIEGPYPETIMIEKFGLKSSDELFREGNLP